MDRFLLCLLLYGSENRHIDLLCICAHRDPVGE